jgi:hypothetical protein
VLQGGTPVEFWMSSDAYTSCDEIGPAGGAYNGMVKPLLNMTIYGAIWYQGESNQGDEWTYKGKDGRMLPTYACRFPAMIQDWRQKWYEGTGGLTDKQFPFGFVQLAAWTNAPLGPAAIRWAQKLTLDDSTGLSPNTVSEVQTWVQFLNSCQLGTRHFLEISTILTYWSSCMALFNPPLCSS